MPENSRAGWPLGIGMAGLVLAAGYQFYLITQPLPFLIDRVFDRDDAYYYFVIARNIAENGTATFDGMHLTNGVQLLWNYILVSLAYFVKEDVAFLRAVLALCLLMNIAAGLLFRQVGKTVLSAELGDVAVLLWAGSMVGMRVTFQGMEFSLHMVVILAIMLIAWKLIHEKQLGNIGLIFLLGLFLALNFWVRLDSVLFSIAIWGTVSYMLFRQRSGNTDFLRAVSALTILPFAGAVAYVLTSYTMAGTLLPLSGTVKAYYAGRFFDGVGLTTSISGQVGWWLKIQTFQALNLIPPNLFSLNIGQALRPLSYMSHFAIPAVVIGVTLWGLWRIWFRYGRGSDYARLAISGLFIWGISAVHVTINVVAIADFSHITRHYYGWLLVFWFFWGGLLVLIVLRELNLRWRRPVIWIALAVFFGAYATLAIGYVTKPSATIQNYAAARMALAPWLNRNLPDDAVIGAWNAGLLGFLSDRPVISLDGLANDKEFLDFLRSGQPFQTYFRDAGITHIVDQNSRDLTMPMALRWDREAHFRNNIPWDEVDVLRKEAGIYVLRLKN